MKKSLKKSAQSGNGEGKKSRLPVILVIACVVAIAAVMVFVAASRSKGKGGMPGGGFGGGRGGAEQSEVSVRTMRAEKTVLHDYVNTNGEIQPQSSIDVFPDMSGKITRVNVSLGSTVNRGQVIAEVDPSTPGAQYRSSLVTAPISGTITRSPLKPGATVSPNTAITVIGDVENLQIEANIPERYVSELHIGLKADIILEAYPEQTFTATVSRVSPLVDATSRTKEIILNFDQNDSRINAGMFAKVKLWTSDYADEIAIPSTAVIEKNNKFYAYVVKGDLTAEQREITTGKTVDNFVQILSGIYEGETVVIEGMRVLSNGSKVRDITNGNQSAERTSSENKPNENNREKFGGER